MITITYTRLTSSVMDAGGNSKGSSRTPIFIKAYIVIAIGARGSVIG
jgi:hypothetical protein